MMQLLISQSEKVHTQLRSALSLLFIGLSEHPSLLARSHGMIFKYAVCCSHMLSCK